jgi:hypothetical protein
VTDAEREIDALAVEIIALHTAEYHPGLRCAENTEGTCLDRFGGEPDPHMAELDQIRELR